MTLKKLKSFLDKLTPAQLKQELIYNSEDLGISGVVKSVTKARGDLYYTGEDDPARLYTKAQLKEDYEKDEIDEMEVEIPKGGIVINL